MSYRKGLSKKSRSTKSGSLASEAYKAKPDEFVFEDEAILEGASFEEHIILLYGPPKIGKSTLAQYLEGVYFLPTEPGYKWLRARKSYINNWATFRAFVQKMEKSKKKCATVKIWCVDTVDNLSKFCMQYTCGREGISHPTDMEWGKGWEAFRDEFTHWIFRLCALSPGAIFISHEKEREVVSRSMKITKVSPALPGSTYTVINNLADIILNMAWAGKKTKKGTIAKRCLYTKPTEVRDAGDRTGVLPDKIFFKTEEEAVKLIINHFNEGTGQTNSRKRKKKVKRKKK